MRPFFPSASAHATDGAPNVLGCSTAMRYATLASSDKPAISPNPCAARIGQYETGWVGRRRECGLRNMRCRGTKRNSRHIKDIREQTAAGLSIKLIHLLTSARSRCSLTLGSMSDNFSDNQSPEEDNQYSRNYDDNPVYLQPLPPQPKPKEKCRKNAKIESINKTIYAHEDESFAEVLEAAIIGVGCEDILKFKVVSDNLRASNFSDQMVEETLNKAKPSVKLDFTEKSSAAGTDKDDEDSDEEEISTSRSKKRKTRLPVHHLYIP
ncbi:hypothetical protein B0H13DRAFT_2270231 [Mycena leptocephala]|nr:hypothetical protein B0H13DRAFT_2270231 [Mycena leptocephala]